jgi:hypothetical protein
MAIAIFDKLLSEASQPLKSPTSACLKLCSFTQQCTKSTNPGLRKWAFAKETSLGLFEFYLEWNEHDQNRCMRLVLDVLVTCVSRNPDSEVGIAIKIPILDNLIATASRQSTRARVKSSLLSLVHFLSKRAVSLDDMVQAYRRVITRSTEDLSDLELWRSLIADIFSWMNLRYVCPTAGKLLLFLFQGLRALATSGSRPDLASFDAITWLAWVQDGLATNPDIMESIKNYVFVPLFEAEKPSALQLLEAINHQNPIDTLSGDVDHQALLQITGLEVGRKYGLVDEPGKLSNLGYQLSISD